MDLYAYSQIESLESILEVCNLAIPRLRGLRLMKFEEVIPQSDIDAMIEDNIDNYKWMNLDREIDDMVKRCRIQLELFNRFAGKNVLYVHTRVGGGNREAYAEEITALQANPHYLGDADDGFDSTYCDFYFDISGIDLDKIDFKKEDEQDDK